MWVGRFRGSGGFAVSTREYFMAAHKYIPKLKLAPLSLLEENSPFDRFKIDQPPDDKDFIIINHSPMTDPEADAYFSVWEFDHIPSSWIDIFNQAKVIMTQSNFCKDIFSKSIDDSSKIHVIPYIIPKEFSHIGSKTRLFQEETFIFGSVFEWVPRKAPERTIKAFIEEFDEEEDIKLVLHTKHPYSKDISTIIKEITDDPRIILHQEFIFDMPSFYRGFDAYISSTAGEGFGQTLIEAMICGLPTIGSRHSGNMDFMNDENSFLVDVNGWSQVHDPSPLIPDEDFKWKLPKIDSIRKEMRYIYDNKNNKEIKSKIKNAIKLKRILNPKDMGSRIYDVLNRFI